MLCFGIFVQLSCSGGGVNQNIRKEWRTLHITFGRIGLLSLSVQFICRTSVLLQHFNTDSIKVTNWHAPFDTTSVVISEDTGSNINTFTCVDRTGSRMRSRGVYMLTNATAPSIYGVPVSCWAIPDSPFTQNRIALWNAGPSAALPTKLPASFWNTLADLGGDWIWEQKQLDTNGSVKWFLNALTTGSLLWVIDGSLSCSPDISGTGWIVQDTMTNRRRSCSFYEISKLTNSYCVELLGLCSIHVFILALAIYIENICSSTMNLWWDNKGVLRTSSRSLKQFQPTSKCADFLWVYISTMHT